LDAHETREMYDKLAMSKVKIPIEVPNYLQTLVDNNQITSFDFSIGGQFVVDSKLSAVEIFKMLKILTALVTMKKNDNNQHEYINRAYRLVPQMIVDFADIARLHEGFRLIQRCIGHAIDPQTYSILFATGYIVDYNNKPFLF
jgi:hypothetical protein